MEMFRTRATVTKGGRLSLKGLPFRPGQTVEVIVRAGEKQISAERAALAQELGELFKEIQALPQARVMTEDEIAAELAAFRAEQRG